MNGMPGNIAPADVDASELPDGFSLAQGGGGGAAGGGGGPSEQAAQRDAQRQSILEQAMTPEALARLRRVKVSYKYHANVVLCVVVLMKCQVKLLQLHIEILHV